MDDASGRTRTVTRDDGRRWPWRRRRCDYRQLWSLNNGVVGSERFRSRRGRGHSRGHLGRRTRDAAHRHRKRLTIEGHTCSDGPLEWNERLSRERAATVRGLLSGECGVAADRLSTVGFGPRKAITDEYCHRRRNRRVEFLVL